MTDARFTPVQRAGVLAELPALLAEFGVPAADVFAGTGIDPAVLTPQTEVPFAGLVLLLERAAERAGMPDLGLRLGLRFRIEHHGPLGRLMATAPTLDHALTDFAFYQPQYSSAAIVYLHRHAGAALLGYGVYAPSAVEPRQLYDTVAAIGVRMLAELSGGAARPLEVLLTRRRPPDPAVFTRALRAPVRFDEAWTAILVDERTLKTRLPGTAPAEHSRTRADLDARLAGLGGGMAGRARHVIRPLLQSDRATMDVVAHALGLHPRTLRRRLAAEGTTFEAVRDAVRHAIARELLAMTDLPVGDVAAAVGFASSGTFAEGFRRRGGLSPSAFRAEARAAARGPAVPPVGPPGGSPPARQTA